MDFWWFLGAQLRAKLIKKSIIWPLVGKLAEMAKMIKKKFCFCIFDNLANLPTRGHMIDFLFNLAFNMSPKTFEKSTQEASKIDQKGHR